MCQLLKVSGGSLSPRYHDGDYVLAAPVRWTRPVKPGDIVVFRSPDGGQITIKQVDGILPDGRLFVSGTHDLSVDSRLYGPISPTDVIGKVIWHIRR